MSTFTVARCLSRCSFVRLLTVRKRKVSDWVEEHFCTLTYQRRPYGVGLLVAGVDVLSVSQNDD